MGYQLQWCKSLIHGQSSKREMTMLSRIASARMAWQHHTATNVRTTAAPRHAVASDTRPLLAHQMLPTAARFAAPPAHVRAR